MPLSIQNLTRGSSPRVDFSSVKNYILGEEYELSLVLTGSATSRRLNRTMRGKDYATNVLSFPLSKKSGEIFLDLATAKKEYKKFSMSYKKFLTYLLIHGLLHLKGMQHGRKMEEAEKKNLDVATNRSWY